jgi:hypothetical protein
MAHPTDHTCSLVVVGSDKKYLADKVAMPSDLSVPLARYTGKLIV